MAQRALVRNRWVYAAGVVGVIVLGLASRHFRQYLPAILSKNAGDILWALMVFVGLGLLFPKATTLRLAAIALVISYLDEFSQMYHAPWIDGLRHTMLGGLILGFGFHASDLVCYTIGVLIGVALELLLGGIIRRPESRVPPP
jgi:hypothetical protein